RLCLYFFFSSRRRHTRFSRDWSSDVCSSDLAGILVERAGHGDGKLPGQETNSKIEFRIVVFGPATHQHPVLRSRQRAFLEPAMKIGRASCRERVEIREVALAREKI